MFVSILISGYFISKLILYIDNKGEPWRVRGEKCVGNKAVSTVEDFVKGSKN